jgi:hypothetical protein
MSKSSIFKTNSRFAILSEPNVNEEKKKKQNDKNDSTLVTNDKPRRNNFKADKQLLDNERPIYTERPVYTERPMYSNESNLFSQKVVDKAYKERKENELNNINNEIIKTLSMDNFPELKVTNNKSIENTQKPVIINFSEKLKPLVNVEEKPEIKQIPYGWAVIKRDKTTNKSVIEYNKDYENDVKKSEKAKMKKWTMKVLDALVDLHETERDKYINKCGYDAYEEKYLDPDYDDEYFDKLDAEYAREKEKETYEEEYEEEDYIEQNKYYWKY